MLFWSCNLLNTIISLLLNIRVCLIEEDIFIYEKYEYKNKMYYLISALRNVNDLIVWMRNSSLDLGYLVASYFWVRQCSTYSVCQFAGSFYFLVLEGSWRQQRRDLRAARGSLRLKHDKEKKKQQQKKNKKTSELRNLWFMYSDGRRVSAYH